jgi:hypothetical protein
VGDIIPATVVEDEAINQQHIAIIVPEKVTVEIGVGCYTPI